MVSYIVISLCAFILIIGLVVIQQILLDNRDEPIYNENVQIINEKVEKYIGNVKNVISAIVSIWNCRGKSYEACDYNRFWQYLH